MVLGDGQKATGEAERDFTGHLAGFLLDDLALNQKDLCDMREVEIVVERRVNSGSGSIRGRVGLPFPLYTDLPGPCSASALNPL